MDEAIQFAAMGCQVDLGNFNAAIHKPGSIQLPQIFPMHTINPKVKDQTQEIEKKILTEYKKLVGTTEIAAKYKYVQLCRSLRTYGLSFFPCTQQKAGAKKPTNLLLGVSKSHYLLVEPTTKEEIKKWESSWLKRWATSGQTITLDFGDREEEFILIQTDRADDIAQCISGYIDILFKRSKEDGVYLDDDDSQTGNTESMGRIRGQAAMGFTSSVTGGHSAGHAKVSVGAAQSRALMIRQGKGSVQTIEITDIPSAIANISERLESIPKEFSRSTSSLTPKQWSEQLNANFGALSAAAGKLQDYMNTGGNVDRNQMNNYAREIAMAVGNMLSSARNASAGQPEDDMPLFDAAKAVSEAIKSLLQASQDLANNPNDPVARNNWKNAQDALRNAGIRLESAQKGALIDDGAKRLLLESARAVAAATEALCGDAEAAAAGLTGANRDRILQAVKMMQNAGLATNDVANILAPVMLGTEAKRAVEDSAAALKRMGLALLAAAQEGGIDPGQMESLSRAAQAVNDALAQLLTASMTAEERMDPEERNFADAANDILHGTAVMLSAKGKPQVMKDQAQKILAASGRLIQATKQHAANAPDEATRNRLMACAKRVADATRKLMTDANAASQNPGDEAAWMELANSSRAVGEATRLLIGDASKETALKALRSNAKKAAADTTSLLTAVQIAAASIKGTQEEMNLLNAARAASEALKQLLNATAYAAQHPDDIAANQKLTQDAKGLGPGVFGLVNAAKQAVPIMTDEGKRNNLVMAANNAGTSVKTMLESMSRVLAVAGVAEIEEALEVFDAVGAKIESALMFAETSGLPADGSSREQALEALNAGVKALAGATKDIATLKDNPSQLGPAAKTLANSVQMTVDASASVAANTPSRAAQKQILISAKHLNSEGTKLAKAARAVVENPSDVDLFNVLSRAVKDTADALQALIGASKGAEPGAREIEQAIRTLKEEVAKLNKNGPAGDFKAVAEELTSITKALGAATQHLTGTARNNAPALGSSANAVKQTIPPLVAAANKAAASAPEAAQQTQILQSVGGLAQNLGTLLTAARAAGARPDDQGVQAQVAEANRGVAAALKKVADSVSTMTPAQRTASAAVDQAADAVRQLNVAGAAPGTGREYESLMASSKALAAATAGVVKATTGGGNDQQQAQAAQQTAHTLEQLISYVRTAAAAAGASGDDAMSAAAGHVKHSAQTLRNCANQEHSPEVRNKIIEATKEMAAHTSALVGNARQQSLDIKDSNPAAYQGMVNAGKAIAEQTGKLVEAAKASSAGDPNGRGRMAESSGGLISAIDQLLTARSQAGSAGGNYNPDGLSPDSEALVGATKSVGAATNQLLAVTADLVSGKKNAQQAQPQVAAAAKAITNSLQALQQSANYLKPGARDLEYAIQQSQHASQQLQDSSLEAAIGMLPNTAPPGTSYQEMQETLAGIAKEAAVAVKDFAMATRGSPEQVGSAARKVGDVMAKLQETAMQAAGTLTDQQRQQEGLEQAKTITDAVHGILEATKAGDERALGAQAATTSQAIQAFLEYLKGGVLGMREVDEAIHKISQDTKRLQTSLDSVPKNPNYNQCQENLQTQAKNLAVTLNNLTKVAKATPDQLGPASGSVAAAIPSLIKGALETAASTPQAAVQQPLLNSTRNIADGTADLLRQAKSLAADPSNAMHANNMSKAFGQVTSNIRDFIKAVKEGNVGEAMINQATESILKTLSTLDQSSLYAAAGQLEPDSESLAEGEKAAGEAVINVAKQMAATATGVVKARGGTPEQAGSAAQALAKTVQDLGSSATALASLSADQPRQQQTLSAARSVGEASEQLLRLCKDQADQQALSAQVTQISENLKTLVGVVQASMADRNKGLAKLEEAKSRIKQGLGEFMNSSAPGKADAKTDDVVESAKSIADATSEMVSATTGSAEELVAAAEHAANFTVELLQNTKTAAAHKDAKPDVVDKVNSAVNSVSNAMIKFLDAARAQKEKPSPDNQRKLSEFAGAVVDNINEVVSAASELPGGANAEAIFRGGDDLEDLAERELLNAANVIEEAARLLLKAKKRRAKNPDVKVGEDLVGAVLSAAEAIAVATGNLVRAATVVQKELVAQGRTTKDKVSVYKKDPAWAKGLISAAKSVAGSVQLLVTAANNAATGQTNEAELIAAARGVAAATARLVAASRTKADPMSPSLGNLQNCAKHVASATAQLVQAAKDAGSEAVQEEAVDYSALSAIQKTRMEHQKMSELEALQKQLAEQERALKAFHQKDYVQARGRGGTMK